MEGNTKEDFERVVKERQIEEAMENWTVFDSGPFQENLYEVPHDALVVLGAYGHGLIKQLAFGSKMELIQSVLSNSIVIVGPHCGT